MGDKKITHLCRWLILLKFTRFLGGPNRPKICSERTKTDFKDRACICIEFFCIFIFVFCSNNREVRTRIQVKVCMQTRVIVFLLVFKDIFVLGSGELCTKENTGQGLLAISV